MNAKRLRHKQRRRPSLIGAMVTTAFTVASLAACDATPGGSADSPEQNLVLESSDVHVLATSDAIATVEDLEVLPNGTVWVLNSGAPFFVGFDGEGNVLQMHGRQGGGPGEFGAPVGFVAGGIGGEAWAFDQGRHAVIQVSSRDAERLEILLPREEIPPGSVLEGMHLLSNRVRTARLGDELILPRASIEGEISATHYWFYVWDPDLVALNTRTESVRPVIALSSVLGDPRPHFELPSDGFPPFPLWFRLWAVCSDEEIRVYDRLREEIRGFTRDGVELEATALPPAQFTEVSPRHFARVAFDYGVMEAAGALTPGITEMSAEDSAGIVNNLVPRLNASPDQLANLLPRYVDFGCAADGTQWIRPLDLERGGLNGGPVWLRITPGGETHEVSLPDRFDPYRFTPDRIWGVQRDDLDVASVAWIDVPATR